MWGIAETQASLKHEALVELFRKEPELAPLLLREVLHLELPAYTKARLETADLTQVVPTEYRADVVVLLVDGKPVLGIVVEVQLARDQDKWWNWPVYVAALRARHRCSCCLLVVTADAGVARWELAVLSAMAHGRGDVETAIRIALSAKAAFSKLDRERATLLLRLRGGCAERGGEKGFFND